MQPLDSFDITHIRKLLDSVGYAYTVVPDSGADLATELQDLGRPVPQYGAGLVRQITPDPRYNHHAMHAQSQSSLSPHTELYEFAEVPPRYLALHCVRQAEGPGGETLLADGHRMLDAFSKEEQELLFTTEYEWGSLVYEHDGLDHLVRHPALRTVAGEVVFSFSTRDFRVVDDLSARYLAIGRRYFDEQRIAVKLRPGTLLIWDNWRMYHARTAFEDPNRLLRRMLFTPDPAE